MANITVHLTLSGLIILQPIIGVSPYKWRVLVPDFSKHAQKHVAFAAVDKAELVSSGAGIEIVPLAGMKVHIADVKAPGSAAIAEEVIDLRETCDPLTAGCAKILTAAELAAAAQTPALELFVADAQISATAIDKTVPWFFDWGGGKTKPKKGQKAWVAEEVCLTFTTNEPTFRMLFTHGSNPASFELKPVANDQVEIAIRNIGVLHHATHHQTDPHFRMYYELFKNAPAKEADLRNRQTVAGRKTYAHEHRLRLVKEDGTIGEEALRRAQASSSHRTTPSVGAGLSLLDVFILSMTGSNCPPGTGDPWP